MTSEENPQNYGMLRRQKRGPPTRVDASPHLRSF